MKRFFGVVLLLALLALVGCGGTSSSGGGSQPAAGGGEKKPIHLKLASSSPLSGGAVNLGEAIKFGVQAALNDRKADLTAAGYDIEFSPQDDEGKPEVGAQIAAQLASDPQVIAVVGTLNSGVAKAELPKYKDSHLVMVSPANTNPDLTKQGYDAYDRVCFTDDYQGPSGARFAVKQLNIKSAWVVNDQTPYGLGLANNFKAEAEKLGVKILGTSDTKDNQADFQAQVTAIAAANPDLVYYGGLAPAGSNLIKQGRDKMPKVIFMGGDGWDDPALIQIGGPAANNTYVTSVYVDYSKAETKAFVDAYKKVSSNKDPLSYSGYAYDSANIIINALIKYAKDNPGKTPGRADIAKLVRATKGYKGLGGEVSFDANGDNPSSEVWVFKVDNGKQVTVGPAPKV